MTHMGRPVKTPGQRVATRIAIARRRGEGRGQAIDEALGETPTDMGFEGGMSSFVRKKKKKNESLF